MVDDPTNVHVFILGNIVKMIWKSGCDWVICRVSDQKKIQALNSMFGIEMSVVWEKLIYEYTLMKNGKDNKMITDNLLDTYGMKVQNE